MPATASPGQGRAQRVVHIGPGLPCNSVIWPKKIPCPKPRSACIPVSPTPTPTPIQIHRLRLSASRQAPIRLRLRPPPGSLRLRLFLAALAAGEAAATTLTATPEKLAQSDLEITIRWSDLPAPDALDYVAIYSPSSSRDLDFLGYLFLNGSAVVRYGLQKEEEKGWREVATEVRTYEQKHMCYWPANDGVAWRDPGFVFDGLMMKGLEPGRRYFYKVDVVEPSRRAAAFGFMTGI